VELNAEIAKTLLGSLCECDANIDARCPACMVSDFVKSMEAELAAATENRKTATDKYAEGKKAVRAMSLAHNMHIDALNVYWHWRHRACPCGIHLEDDAVIGKCESPWSRVEVEEVTRLNRKEELEAVDEFMKKHNVRRRNGRG